MPEAFAFLAGEGEPGARALEDAGLAVQKQAPRLLTASGAFVTLHLVENDVHTLRGCIGLLEPVMPLALAVKLIESIEAKAAEWGMRVVTAVSDASARPVAVHCMDGAYIGSFDVALNKTYTSIAFQMSTAQLGTLSRPGESLYGIQFTNEGRIVIFGGGEVLKRGDAIVGALGVSGGSAEQDTALAAYGRSVFERL